MLSLMLWGGFFFAASTLPQSEVTNVSIRLEPVETIAIESLTSWPPLYIKKDGVIYPLSGLPHNHSEEKAFIENKTLGIKIEIPASMRANYRYQRIDHISSWLKKELLKADMIVENTIVIAAAYFDSNSDLLRNDACAGLDKIVRLMRANRSIYLRVTASADRKGIPSYNKKLAQRRGKSVLDYLVKSGVQASRITVDAVLPGASNDLAKRAEFTGQSVDQLGRRAEFTFDITDSFTLQ